jgi:1,2-diacylglycerol-3-alpha-glucose alpha-1,2-glucosyltransferase
MRILNHLELAGPLARSGIGTAPENQRAALATTEADIEVVTSLFRGGSLREALRRVWSGGGLLRSVDLIHLNMIGPGSVALAVYARYTKTPLILHAHVTREDFAESFRWSTKVGPLLERYLRWFYSHADLVLCPSEYTRSVLESYPVRAPIRPISNGIDLSSIEGHEQLREQYRERFDLSGVVPFAVGSVFERKGLRTFCEVAERMTLDFVWFGEYDTGPHASRTVRRYTQNPPANVQFTGWVEDKPGMFGAGDIFFFPTKVENQGIVVLEAMACGKACIISDIPVFEEFFTDGEDCLKCSTTAEYVEAIDRLADDPDLREELGQNARATAAEHGLENVGEQLLAAYRSVLDSKHGT